MSRSATGNNGRSSSHGGGSRQRRTAPANKHKAAICKWFRELTPEQRGNVLVWEDKDGTTLLKQMYKKKWAEGDGFFLDVDDPQDRVQRLMARERGAKRGASHAGGLATEEGLLLPVENFCFNKLSLLDNYFCYPEAVMEMDALLEESVRLCDTWEYCDTLTVASYILEDADKFLEMMEVATRGGFLMKPCCVSWEEKEKCWVWERPSWFENMGFYSLGTYIAAKLEQALWRRYWQWSNLDPRKISGAEINRAIPKGVRERLFKFPPNTQGLHSKAHLVNFWNSLNVDERHRLVGKIGDIVQNVLIGDMKVVDYQKPLTALLDLLLTLLDERMLEGYHFDADPLVSRGVTSLHSRRWHSDEKNFIEFVYFSPMHRAFEPLDYIVRKMGICIQSGYTEKIAMDLILGEENDKIKKGGAARRQQNGSNTKQQQRRKRRTPQQDKKRKQQLQQEEKEKKDQRDKTKKQKEIKTYIEHLLRTVVLDRTQSAVNRIHNANKPSASKRKRDKRKKKKQEEQQRKCKSQPHSPTQSPRQTERSARSNLSSPRRNETASTTIITEQQGETTENRQKDTTGNDIANEGNANNNVRKDTSASTGTERQQQLLMKVSSRGPRSSHSHSLPAPYSRPPKGISEEDMRSSSSSSRKTLSTSGNMINTSANNSSINKKKKARPVSLSLPSTPIIAQQHHSSTPSKQQHHSLLPKLLPMQRERTIPSLSERIPLFTAHNNNSNNTTQTWASTVAAAAATMNGGGYTSSSDSNAYYSYSETDSDATLSSDETDTNTSSRDYYYWGEEESETDDSDSGWELAVSRRRSSSSSRRSSSGARTPANIHNNRSSNTHNNRHDSLARGWESDGAPYYRNNNYNNSLNRKEESLSSSGGGRSPLSRSREWESNEAWEYEEEEEELAHWEAFMGSGGLLPSAHRTTAKYSSSASTPSNIYQNREQGGGRQESEAAGKLAANRSLSGNFASSPKGKTRLRSVSNGPEQLERPSPDYSLFSLSTTSSLSCPPSTATSSSSSPRTIPSRESLDSFSNTTPTTFIPFGDFVASANNKSPQTSVVIFSQSTNSTATSKNYAEESKQPQHRAMSAGNIRVNLASRADSHHPTSTSAGSASTTRRRKRTRTRARSQPPNKELSISEINNAISSSYNNNNTNTNPIPPRTSRTTPASPSPTPPTSPTTTRAALTAALLAQASSAAAAVASSSSPAPSLLTSSSSSTPSLAHTKQPSSTSSSPVSLSPTSSSSSLLSSSPPSSATMMIMHSSGNLTSSAEGGTSTSSVPSSAEYQQTTNTTNAPSTNPTTSASTRTSPLRPSVTKKRLLLSSNSTPFFPSMRACTESDRYFPELQLASSALPRVSNRVELLPYEDGGAMHTNYLRSYDDVADVPPTMAHHQGLTTMLHRGAAATIDAGGGVMMMGDHALNLMPHAALLDNRRRRRSSTSSTTSPSTTLLSSIDPAGSKSNSCFGRLQQRSKRSLSSSPAFTSGSTSASSSSTASSSSSTSSPSPAGYPPSAMDYHVQHWQMRLQMQEERERRQRALGRGEKVGPKSRVWRGSGPPPPHPLLPPLSRSSIASSSSRNHVASSSSTPTSFTSSTTGGTWNNNKAASNTDGNRPSPSSHRFQSYPGGTATSNIESHESRYSRVSHLLTQSLSDVERVLFLHKEIEDYVNYTIRLVQARKTEQEEMIQKMRAIVYSLWPYPAARVECYGSFATGLAIPSSDLDMVVLLSAAAAEPMLTPRSPTTTGDILKRGWSPMKRLAEELKKQVWLHSLQMIETAKVPVLKVVSVIREEHILIDITFSIDDLPTEGCSMEASAAGASSPTTSNNTSSPPFGAGPHWEASFTASGRQAEYGVLTNSSPNEHSGVAASKLVRSYVRSLPALTPLALVLKQLLHDKGLNNTYTGGISSYCLVLMIVAYLRFSNVPYVDHQHSSVSSSQQDNESAGMKRNRRRASPERTSSVRRARSQTSFSGEGEEREEENGRRGGAHEEDTFWSPTSTDLREEDENLGATLLGFLRFFGLWFDFDRMGITLQNGGAYFYLAEPSNTLVIADPFNPQRNIGHSVFGMWRVKAAFRHAFFALTSPYTYTHAPTLLSRVLQPSPPKPPSIPSPLNSATMVSAPPASSTTPSNNTTTSVSTSTSASTTPTRPHRSIRSTLLPNPRRTVLVPPPWAPTHAAYLHLEFGP
ncbi:hypothetical protein QOT17_010185 [Balamuthia mandrillaris]